LSSFESKIDSETNEVIEENPKTLINGDTAIVKFALEKPICIERFVDYPEFGRFVMRDTWIIGNGIVLEILD
jgi:elongation factor 1-alpha